MGKFWRGVGKALAAPVKMIGKIPRETIRVIDQGLDVANKIAEKTGLNKVLSGGGSVGFTATSGARGGSNVYFKPGNSANAIGVGVSSSGNASLFVNNNVAMPLTPPAANFIEPTNKTISIESVEHSLAERDKMLQEAHGPGYIPESSLATAGAVALVAAAKELYQDSVHLANTATAIYMNNYAVIYSANDKQRVEALNKNLELFENAEKALYAVISNPGIISEHYHNKAQDASNAFATAYNSGNLVAAGNAAGKVVYDIYTASTVATAATAATTKAANSAAKLTHNFVATHKFKPPVTFKFNPGRLNSGIPVDNVKLQNPIEPKLPVPAVLKLHHDQFIRVHAISGKGSANVVKNLVESMRANGFDINEPIEVVIHNNKYYIIDGHHRYKAAKIAGITEIPAKIVTDIKNHPSSWETIEEVVKDASLCGPDNIKFKYKGL